MSYMADICVKKKKIASWLLVSVILLTGCTMPAPAEMETEDAESRSDGEDIEETWISQSPYARAYYAFLQEYLFSAEIWDMRFELVFIDEDDIPELLIILDDCHAAGVRVYTYIDDSVVEVGEFGSFGKMQYVERSGMIFDHYMGQGEAHTYFWRMEGGEAIQVSHMHSWPDNSRYLETGEYMEFYEIDERSVTEDVYQAKWEELYDSQEYVLIGYEDGIPLNETELLPALTQAIENLLWKKEIIFHDYDILGRDGKCIWTTGRPS